MNEIPDDIMKAAQDLSLTGCDCNEDEAQICGYVRGCLCTLQEQAIARALLAEREANAARIGKIEALCTRHAEARSALSTDLLSALDKLAAFRAIEEAFLAERQAQADRIAALEALLKEAVMLLRSAVAPMAAYPADGPNAEEVLRRGDRIEEFLAKTAARAVAEKLKGAGA